MNRPKNGRPPVATRPASPLRLAPAPAVRDKHLGGPAAAARPQSQTAAAGNRPRTPGAVQPKLAGVRRTPQAPPVYRPQPLPRSVQPKTATLDKAPTPFAPTRRTPAAPPAYKPQPVPKVLQRKEPPSKTLGPARAVKQPTAQGPGGGVPRVLQRKTEGARQQTPQRPVTPARASAPAARKVVTPSPTLRPAALRNQGTVQRALWVLGQGAPNEAVRQDIGHLEQTIGASAQSPEISTSKTEAKAAVKPSNYQGGDEDFHILAHAGLYQDDKCEILNPWVGGLDLDKFAKYFVRKYGAQNIEGGRVWLLVCLLGRADVLKTLLTSLHTYGVDNVTVYAPNDYMWISSMGQPHVHDGREDDNDKLVKNIKKYNSKPGEQADTMIRTSLGFQDVGRGWIGYKMTNGVVNQAPLSTLTTEGDVDDMYYNPNAM